jgi:hypothetical protein
VWVYVIVHDDKIDELLEARRPGWNQLREDIRGVVARVRGPDVNPYVRVRALSEVEGMVAVQG